jgi:hypothetical protein
LTSVRSAGFSGGAVQERFISSHWLQLSSDNPVQARQFLLYGPRRLMYLPWPIRSLRENVERQRMMRASLREMASKPDAIYQVRTALRRAIRDPGWAGHYRIIATILFFYKKASRDALCQGSGDQSDGLAALSGQRPWCYNH